MGKKLTETSAGRHLFTKARNIIFRRQEVIQRIQAEMKRPTEASTCLQPLHEEHRRLTKSLESTIEEMRVLSLHAAWRFLEKNEKWLLHKLLVLRLMLLGPAKVDEAVDGIEGEASGPKEPFKDSPELSCKAEAKVDSSEVLVGPAKADEVVNGIEGGASGSSGPLEESTELPYETETKVDSSEVDCVQ